MEGLLSKKSPVTSTPNSRPASRLSSAVASELRSGTSTTRMQTPTAPFLPRQQEEVDEEDSIQNSYPKSMVPPGSAGNSKRPSSQSRRRKSEQEQFDGYAMDGEGSFNDSVASNELETSDIDASKDQHFMNSFLNNLFQNTNTSTDAMNQSMQQGFKDKDEDRLLVAKGITNHLSVYHKINSS